MNTMESMKAMTQKAVHKKTKFQIPRILKEMMIKRNF